MPTHETEQKFHRVSPIFIVHDLVGSAEFYRDKLGFRFDRYWGEPPSFVMVHRDDVVIMLQCAAPIGNAGPNSAADDDPWDAYIYVKNAKALYDEFMDRGVPIARKICDQHYGCRDFDLVDNSGYRLCFGQDLDR